MSAVSIVFFERDLKDTDTESVVDEWLEEVTKEELAGKYSVVLHNDPINGVDFVTRVIHAVFGYGLRKSAWLMLKAHFTGRSTLWVGAKGEAEQKRNEMIAHGPDPNMLHKGAQPLTVTVERNE